jgi:hypothetical protein
VEEGEDEDEDEERQQGETTRKRRGIVEKANIYIECLYAAE